MVAGAEGAAAGAGAAGAGATESALAVPRFAVGAAVVIGGPAAEAVGDVTVLAVPVVALASEALTLGDGAIKSEIALTMVERVLGCEATAGVGALVATLAATGVVVAVGVGPV